MSRRRLMAKTSFEMPISMVNIPLWAHVAFLIRWSLLSVGFFLPRQGAKEVQHDRLSMIRGVGFFS